MTYQIDGIDYTESDYKLDTRIVKTPRILKLARENKLLDSGTFEYTHLKRRFLEETLGMPGLRGTGTNFMPFDQCSEARIGRAFQNTLLPYLKLEPRATPTEVAMAQYRIDRYEQVRNKVVLEELLTKSHEDLRKRRLALDEKLKELGQEHIRRMHLGAIGLYLTDKEVKDNPTGENTKH